MTQEFRNYMNASLHAYELYLKREYESPNTRNTMMNDAVRFASFLSGIPVSKQEQIGRQIPN